MKRLPGLIVVIWATGLIAGLEAYALSQGVNGTFFSVSVAAIVALGAGFAGFQVNDWWRRR